MTGENACVMCLAVGVKVSSWGALRVVLPCVVLLARRPIIIIGSSCMSFGRSFGGSEAQAVPLVKGVAHDGRSLGLVSNLHVGKIR